MRLLILGTSNSILRNGYVDGLAAALPNAEIVNKSIGQSPGIQFASVCEDDLSRYDWVIFDSVVNDENQLYFIGSKTFFASVLFQVLSTISSQTKLLVVGFCNEKFVDAKSDIFLIHEQCAHRAGALFCDIREFFAAFPKITPVFFDAGVHLELSLAYKFGGYLAQKIASGAYVSSARRAKSYAANFRVHDISLICRTAYTKTNSLASWSFGVLDDLEPEVRLSDVATSRDASGFIILGVYIDRANTNCTLRVSSTNGHAHDYSLLYDVGEERLTVKFVPFRNGATGDRLGLVAAVGARSPHEERARPAATPPRAAIAKVVCWKGS